ncbi:MAG: transglutaminase-like cysteine peptidase [Oceanicaulis sp.]
MAAACATTAPPASSQLTAVGVAAAPVGFVEMCLADPEACGAQSGLALQPQVEMDAALWATVIKVNRGANRAIRYVPDQTFGNRDLWRIADSAGDCEDYALAKRAALLELGFPGASLRLATVFSRRTGHHAVLVLSTTDGDYVLDNNRDAILPWSDTDFAWVSVQSAESPMRWLRVASRGGVVADLSPEATAGG